MKKLLALAVVIVAGLLAYNWQTTGELRLIPQTGPSSPEEERLDDLQDRYDDAMKSWANAQRGTGLAGIDMTADADAAFRELDQVRNQLERFVKSVDDDGLNDRARKLLRTVNESLRRMR